MFTDEELRFLSEKELKFYQSLPPERQATYVEARRRGSGTSNGTRTETTPSSTMHSWGKIGSIITFVAAFLITFATKESYGEGLRWAVLSFTFCGFFIFMWMLGAIETRLIEINETLKSRSDHS